jgi:KaiC/GvpD/RAD55 family RecA-like ATPase
VHDRLARRKHALRVGIAGRAVHVADHVLHDLVRRIETEHGQVADVELDDLVAVVLHLARLFERGAADLVADVVQLVRFQNRSHNITLSNQGAAETVASM